MDRGLVVVTGGSRGIGAGRGPPSRARGLRRPPHPPQPGHGRRRCGHTVRAAGGRTRATCAGLGSPADTDIHALGGDPDRVDRLAPALPMGRGGRPNEVIEAIACLISDAASYMRSSLLDLADGR
ncbi:hypothetical protein [Nocardia brevicatena]|uniref:hypothetical protein n=1 Tax=Nocardia brevicatena TaxID=37327 RepID=UPI0003035B0F|nr:hypothetical protein [Nocardia brevicatena]